MDDDLGAPDADALKRKLAVRCFARCLGRRHPGETEYGKLGTRVGAETVLASHRSDVPPAKLADVGVSERIERLTRRGVGHLTPRGGRPPGYCGFGPDGFAD